MSAEAGFTPSLESRLRLYDHVERGLAEAHAFSQDGLIVNVAMGVPGRGLAPAVEAVNRQRGYTYEGILSDDEVRVRAADLQIIDDELRQQ